MKVHGSIRTHLVLDEVAQSFDHDGAAALLLRVSGFQPHNVLGVCNQMLNLPLVLLNFLSLPLKEKRAKEKKISVNKL